MMVVGVVPLHNHAQWVAGALSSIVMQDHRPLRIVVVDDGSTDGSPDAVMDALSDVRRFSGESWCAEGKLEDVTVRLVRFEQARGPSFARNVGIRVGWQDADVFALLDSDDLYEAGKISLSLERFVDPHVGAVYSDYDTLRPDGLRSRQYKEPFSRRRLLRECIVNCDSLVRKSALEACGLFDESLRTCEDYDLWLRLSERFLIAHVPESLLTIRVGPHSSTAQVPGERWRECHQRVFEKLAQRMKRD